MARGTDDIADLLHDEEELSLTAGLDMDGPEPPASPPRDGDCDDDDEADAAGAYAAAEGAFLRAEMEKMSNCGADGVETTPCVHCQAGVAGAFVEAFGIAACHPCRALNHARYKLVTRAYCKTELLLTDRQLDALGTLKVPNPYKKSYHPMRLYLRVQAEDVAMNAWGSEGAIEAERRKREESKLAKKGAKAAKRPRALLPVAAGRGRLAPNSTAARALPAAGARPAGDKRARGPAAGGSAERHEHRFDGQEELVDAANDVYARTCTICKCVCTYEKL